MILGRGVLFVGGGGMVLVRLVELYRCIVQILPVNIRKHTLNSNKNFKNTNGSIKCQQNTSSSFELGPTSLSGIQIPALKTLLGCGEASQDRGAGVNGCTHTEGTVGVFLSG